LKTLATQWRTEGLRRKLMGKEEAESSALYLPHGAEDNPTPVRKLQVANNASPTKAESSVTPYPNTRSCPLRIKAVTGFCASPVTL